MGIFQLWVENVKNRGIQEKVQHLYDLVVQSLLGAARDQIQVPLQNIKDSSPTMNKPPQQNGGNVVLKKLTDVGIFQQLQGLGDNDLTYRASQVQNWLQSLPPNNTVTVGELLTRLFGENALDMYGDRQWQQMPQKNS
jgi:hypothetical protein